MSSLRGAKRARLPTAIKPELAFLVARPPESADWLHEIKLDGYRLLCHVAEGQARLKTRRQLDWTAKFSSLAEDVAKLPVESAIFDGEAVVLDENGVSGFQALQEALSTGAQVRMFYFVFDLLYLNGYDLRGVPLEKRKQLLAEVLSGQKSRVRLCDHLVGDGPAFWRECCRRGLEGIISKRRDRPYLAGRGGDWLKAKCIQHEEFVIGGFTDPNASRQGFGALLIGYYDRQGNLLYAGRVGTGFTVDRLLKLRRSLDRLQTAQPTFANLTPRQAGRGVHWVRPELVCQVEFTNWTRDHVLRHPSFQGLRDDLPAGEVIRDAPVPGGLAEEKSPAKKMSKPRPGANRAAARRRVKD